jgi:hypothetical protein
MLRERVPVHRLHRAQLLAGPVREQEGECSVPAQFQNSPSVISELNVVDAAKTSEGREGSVT